MKKTRVSEEKYYGPLNFYDFLLTFNLQDHKGLKQRMAVEKWRFYTLNGTCIELSVYINITMHKLRNMHLLCCSVPFDWTDYQSLDNLGLLLHDDLYEKYIGGRKRIQEGFFKEIK